MTEKQPPPKDPAGYVREEDQATGRELETDTSRESVQENADEHNRREAPVHVEPRSDGSWAVIREGNKKASGVHSTRERAEKQRTRRLWARR